jgi:signal transduction histidine kinase
MYEIYSGHSPYTEEVCEDVVRDICNPRIRKRPPIPLHCPPRMARLMSECFEHEPAARPTAEQLDLLLKVELKVTQRTSRLEALNKDLELANERIAAASAMQLQHFACMSHEIRTPLNCIIGLSSLMEETELTPMQKESMEMIISSGKLLRQIVDDVLDCKWMLSLSLQATFNIYIAVGIDCPSALSQIRNWRAETPRYSLKRSTFKKH